MTRAGLALTKAIKLLHESAFVAAHRLMPTAFTRRRKLSFALVVVALVHLCKKSLQIECNLIGDLLDIKNPPSKQAFSKARYKISYTGFQALHKKVLEEYYSSNDQGLWHGFRLLGIDGSTCRIPDSPDTESFFGRWERGGGDRPGKQPVIARISEVTDLAFDTTVNGKIVPWKTSEHVLADQQIREVASDMRQWGQGKLLFVFDRGYPSKHLISLILGLRCDFIFRVPRKFNKTIDSCVDSGEQDIVAKLYSDLPELRIVKKELSSKNEAVLLTSCVDQDEYRLLDLFEVYRLRWTGLEEGYKQQKISLELENFIGTNELAVLQEFYATLLIATVLSTHCVDREGPRNISAAQEYRINRSVVMGSLKDDVLKVFMQEIPLKQFEDKFTKIAERAKIKVRPNRSYSREKVGKPKRYHIFRRVS